MRIEPGSFTRCWLLGCSGAAVVAVLAASPANADPPASGTKADRRKPQEVVVVGHRGSAVTSVAPLATLDTNMISATGATSMGELLRIIQPLTQSASGGDPTYLLNGQRTSGYEEIAALPPEAIDKVEVLPEAAALAFGYPPTRRVLNFITKRSFRQTEVKQELGTATRSIHNSAATTDLNLTRLHDDSRLTVALERRQTASIRQSERHLVPDPDVLFDGIGNVTAPDFGEIDPALSQLAGEPVTVAPVPNDAGDLAGYAAKANEPRLFDLGPYRTLTPNNQAWKGEAVYADRIGKTLSGSINLSAETSRDRGLGGLPAALLMVASSNPYSPFDRDILLHRYLSEADPLHLRKTTTALHAGTTLRGVLLGWRWDLTTNLDQKLVRGTSELGIDMTAANAAIAAGADPFSPLDASLLENRLTDRASLRTRAANAKMVITNMPVDLPAGSVTVTGTLEAERLAAKSVTTGADPFSLALGRTRTEAGFAIDIPITSRDNDFISAVGDLSLNASINARRVSGFGALYDHTLGLGWVPFKGVQILVQSKHSGTAPDMEKLASPVVRVANSTVFDFATGRTEVVTLTTGGNPDLLAERKDVNSVSLDLKPFKGRDININATFDDTQIRDETGDIYALTPELETIFPDRVTRDPSGRLVAVTFQPTNFYRERQRSLHMTISANGSVGKKKPDDGSGKGGDRPYYYAGAGPTVRFTDKLQLRPGTPIFDLLNGDTVTGSDLPRVTSYFYGGIGYLGNGAGLSGWYQSGGHVRSDYPASELAMTPQFKLNLEGHISLHHFLPKDAWTSHTQVKLAVENVTGVQPHVVDGNGRVPNRFQPDFLDSIGRTVTLTLRKLF